MDDPIQAVFLLIPQFRDKHAAIFPLEGGLTNRNYRLQIGLDEFVLRLAGADTELLGIDREREVVCVRAAAAAGVGPEVIAVLPEHAALLRRFIPGRVLTADDARQPGVLRRVAETLRRCHDHAVPQNLGAFCPFSTVRTYHRLARERHVPLPENLDRALELLARCEQALQTDEPRCLCHNDLLPSNFIDLIGDGSAFPTLSGAGLCLIDWEYAALGNRYFDLGNLAVNFQLDEEQELELLSCYFGEARPEHRRCLRLMRLASDMREALWGYLQAGISRLHSPADYLEYGRKHLDRFLAASVAVNQAEGA